MKVFLNFKYYDKEGNINHEFFRRNGDAKPIAVNEHEALNRVNNLNINEMKDCMNMGRAVSILYFLDPDDAVYVSEK
jgi:hypothetical protein